MARISKNILKEIQKEARDYIYAVKGNKATSEDIMTAENLITFGYERGLNIINELKESPLVKENRAVINAEWG